MKQLLVIALAIFSNFAVFGQTMSRQGAVADIDSMVRYIVAVHPNPFTVVAEGDFMAEVAGVKAALPDSLDALELWKRAAPLVASIGDGHTNLFLQKNLVGRLGEGHYFPRELSVDVYSLAMTSEGRRVAAINGVSAAEVVGAVLGVISGESTAYRAFDAGMYGWPMLVSILFPSDKYEVSFDDGATVEVAGTDYAGAAALAPEEPRRPDYTYYIIEEKSTAVLEFNRCRDAEALGVLLEKMCAEIRERGIDNLIVDMRNNGGGDTSAGNELLQWISPVPFEQFGKAIVRVGAPLRKLDPEEWPSRDTLLTYEVTELIPLRENPLRFTGKMFMLTSLNTFSSAKDVAWTFQYFDMGTIVGSQTGGFVVCFGDMLPTRLPFSGLALGVSCKEFYNYGATEADRRPVYPDIEVEPRDAPDYVLENLVVL